LSLLLSIDNFNFTNHPLVRQKVPQLLPLAGQLAGQLLAHLVVQLEWDE
jgi:hypothetical protein